MKIDFQPLYKCIYFQNPNAGFNMALLNKDNKAYFTPFMCKDYFQDIFWAERTGNVAEVYGIKCRKGMIDDSVERFKLGIYWSDNNLKDLVGNMQSFVNEFDKAQGFDLTTIESTEVESEALVTFSREWTSNAPLLSTFMSIVRLGGGYNNEGAIKYIKDRLEIAKPYSEDMGNITKINPAFTRPDTLRLKVTANKLAAILSGIKIDAKWSNLTNVAAVHNYSGIYNWGKFPVVKIEDMK